jgi:hypothetical protein
MYFHLKYLAVFSGKIVLAAIYQGEMLFGC